MENNASVMIKTYEELVWRESGYSCNPIKVEPKNRFQNKSQINIIAKILCKRNLSIKNCSFETKKVSENTLIIDYTIEHVN